MKGAAMDAHKALFQSSGFYLEMKIAKAMIDAGMQPFQSLYYIDVDQGVEREVDLVNSMSAYAGSRLSIKISLVLQCKYSKGNPWFVLKRSLDNPNKFLGRMAVISNSECANVIYAGATSEDKNLGFLDGVPHRLGYGMQMICTKKQGEKRQEDLAYEAVRSVISACRGIVSDRNVVRVYKNILHICYPIIVVDGDLCDVSLNHSGETILTSVDGSGFVYNGSDYAYVRFYNYAGFLAVVKELKESQEKVFEFYKEIYEKYKDSTKIGYISRH